MPAAEAQRGKEAIMKSSEKRQTRAIHRTICIGLGGTGRDVIMRIFSEL